MSRHIIFVAARGEKDTSLFSPNVKPPMKLLHPVVPLTLFSAMLKLMEGTLPSFPVTA